jgi:hypothetical protein
VERGGSGDGDGWFGQELDDVEDEINTMTGVERVMWGAGEVGGGPE